MSNKHHNAGQRDGAKSWGSHKSPHGVFSTLISDTKKKSKDNADYDRGFRKARKDK